MHDINHMKARDCLGQYKLNKREREGGREGEKERGRERERTRLGEGMM